MNLVDEAKKRAQKWFNLIFLDKEKAELEKILSDEKKILEHFGSSLKFGTAGMRGIMALGSACLNPYTVAQAGLGIAEFLKKGKIVLGYDARINSKEFAELLNEIFLDRKIEVIFLKEISPTPLVPFVLQRKGGDLGIMVTASHNPPQYNGIKVYASHGAQIIPPIDKEIAEAIEKIPIEEAFQFVKKKPEKSSGASFPQSLYEEYIHFLEKNVTTQKKETPKEKEFYFVYTPLYGAAGNLAKEVFQHFGYSKEAIYVEEQMQPNGNFPNLIAPNPELEDSYQLAKKIALEKNASLIIANDGDGDRLGVMVRSSNGDFVFLNGNELGILLAYYFLLSRKNHNLITGKELLISSVVSSPLLQKIAQYFQCEYRQTLTGFKWMGNLAYELEKKGNLKFIFAYEEAFGYAIGGELDKDGISAALLLLEAASYCRNSNKSLLDLLEDIYSIFGYHKEDSWQLEYSPLEERKEQEVLSNLRKNPPKSLLNEKIVLVKDFYYQKIFYEDKEEELTGFPKENLFLIESSSYWLAIRPSGTEPKVKAYFGVCLSPKEDKKYAKIKAEEAISGLKKQVESLFES